MVSYVLIKNDKVGKSSWHTGRCRSLGGTTSGDSRAASAIQYPRSFANKTCLYVSRLDPQHAIAKFTYICFGTHKKTNVSPCARCKGVSVMLRQ